MTRLLVYCLIANLVCICIAGALLWFYPKASGFTFTTAQNTRYLAGGPLLGAAILSLSDLVIGACIIWCLLRMW